MATRSSFAWMLAILLVLGAGPAAGQGAIQPLAAPVQLGAQRLPAMPFAGEAINDGIPLPSNPARMLLEGEARMLSVDGQTLWHLVFDRLTLDTTVIGGVGPLGNLFVVIDPVDPKKRSVSQSIDGLLRSPYAMSPGAQLILRSMADTIGFALFAPPRYPIADRTPVLDLNAAIARHVYYKTGGRLTQSAAPAIAAGLVDFDGRTGLLVRQSGPFALTAFGQNIALESDSQGVIDIESGLPLVLETRITGKVAPGNLDFKLRLALALGRTDDPRELLARMANPPPSAASQPQPVKAVAKPAAPPAPTPAAAKATPTAPAAVGAPKPGTITFEEMQKQLGALQELLKQGKITKDQYEAQQQILLGRL